jgi:predicted dehydrogenase
VTPLKWLVVGGTPSGILHLKALYKMGEKHVGLVEPDESKWKALTDFVPPWRIAPSMEGMEIAQPDVVIFAQPKMLPESLLALDAGCHVILEKPLGDTLELRETILSRLNGRMAFTSCPMRYHPILTALVRPQVQSLGKVTDASVWVVPGHGVDAFDVLDAVLDGKFRGG